MTYMDVDVVLTQLLEVYAIVSPFVERPHFQDFSSDFLPPPPPFCLTLSSLECEQISDREEKVDRSQSILFLPPLSRILVGTGEGGP